MGAENQCKACPDPRCPSGSAHCSLAGEKKQRKLTRPEKERRTFSLADASAGAAFDLGKLESYTVAQLRQFCKNLVCPIKGYTRKVELQKARRAWVTAAKDAEGHTEENEEREEQSIHNGVLGRPVMTRGTFSMAGSSVSTKGLTPEELQDRQAGRFHQLELEKMRMDIEEKRLLLAHELSLRKLDQRSQSSRVRSSNNTVQPERRVHIPNDLVKDYKREDDILLWIKGYESALNINLVPEAHWGAGLWKHFKVEGRDSLRSLWIPRGSVTLSIRTS
ncbi:hypothetical protein NDU88_003034 [Pleurodeles waltl]|uniref:Uncharacterized protein n=1 Tax=Pleurodeles waltl TaxID=8319 RepID=A0AAV7LE78_PLEWA|nr:hypothetical protein NDU88_003034 [Pleurodeles waltl]